MTNAINSMRNLAKTAQKKGAAEPKASGAESPAMDPLDDFVPPPTLHEQKPAVNPVAPVPVSEPRVADITPPANGAVAVRESAGSNPDEPDRDAPSPKAANAPRPAADEGEFLIDGPTRPRATTPFANFIERLQPKQSTNAGEKGAMPEIVNGPPNKKKIAAVGIVALVLALVLKMLLSGDGTVETPAATPPQSSTPSAEPTPVEPGNSKDDWIKVKTPEALPSFSTPPLGDQERVPPELLSGVDRARIVQDTAANTVVAPTTETRAISETSIASTPANTAGETPAAASTSPAPGKTESAIEEIRTSIKATATAVAVLNERVDTIQKEVEGLKAQRTATRRSAVSDKPKMELKAITRTPGCSTCRPFALVKVLDGFRQVGTGDSLHGYTVSVEDDHVLLTKGKLQHSYYLDHGFTK